MPLHHLLRAYLCLLALCHALSRSLKKARQSARSGVTGAGCIRPCMTRDIRLVISSLHQTRDIDSLHQTRCIRLVLWSRPRRSGGHEPGVEAIGRCVHKRRALNTRLSSGTSAGTFACPAGPYIHYRNEAGTKNEPDTYFVPVQKKGWKIDPHVSNLRSREFLFQGVQVHR